MFCNLEHVFFINFVNGVFRPSIEIFYHIFQHCLSIKHFFQDKKIKNVTVYFVQKRVIHKNEFHKTN